MRKWAVLLTVVLGSTCFQSCSGLLSAGTNTGSALLGTPFGSPLFFASTPNFGTPFIQVGAISNSAGFVSGGAGTGP